MCHEYRPKTGVISELTAPLLIYETWSALSTAVDQRVAIIDVGRPVRR